MSRLTHGPGCVKAPTICWGHFNPFSQNWDLTTLKSADFPVEILPVVECSGASVGKLCSQYKGLTQKIALTAALGDMQCSVLSCRVKSNEAVLNISTSAQLSMVVSRKMRQRIKTEDADYTRPKSFVRVPFFKEQDLLTSASLNGGRVFAEFINMISSGGLSFSVNSNFQLQKPF